MSNSIACLIVDDEPLAAKVLKEHISEIPQLELIGVASSAMDAFAILSSQHADLLLLDIQMPNMNGIEFIKSLKSPPSVIITTAYREYAFESYEIEVVDYLLKPISFNRFFKAITKFIGRKEGSVAEKETSEPISNGGSIYVYSNKKNLKVYFDDIQYVESIKDYITIHTSSDQIVSKSTITKFEDLLSDSFIRIHRSFIVNTKHITAYTHQDVELGKVELPIGSSYKQKVIALLKN